MKKAFSCFLIFLSFSCANHHSHSNDQKPLLLQAEKCIVDGGSICIRCGDGRQKVIELGYGKFTLIEEEKISQAYTFCDQEPVELSLNVRNAHVKHEEIKAANGFKVLHENLVNSCLETHKVENFGRIRKLNVELIPMTAESKLDDIKL